MRSVTGSRRYDGAYVDAIIQIGVGHLLSEIKHNDVA